MKFVKCKEIMSPDKIFEFMSKRFSSMLSTVTTHQSQFFVLGWVVGLKPIVRTQDLGLRGSALRGSLSKVSYPIFTRVSEKTTGNSERLGLLGLSGNWTWHLLSTSFEGRTFRPPVGLTLFQMKSTKFKKCIK